MRDTLTLGEIAEGLSLEGNEAMEWIEGRWRDGFRQLQAQAAELERLLAIMEVVKLRCGYILGACRGEVEMRLEAEAILDRMTNGEGS